MKKGLSIFILVLLLTTVPALADTERPFTYYVAGAYSDSDGFAYLDIFNPSDSAADIEVLVYHEKNDTSSLDFRMAPGKNARVDFKGQSTGVFGLEVKSDRQVIVNSVQFDDTYSGGFGGAAAEEAGFAWYFGEGYSSGMAKTYLYLLNPGMRESKAGVVLYYDNGQRKTFNVHVPASRVVAVDMKDKTQPEKRFGIKVTSPVPIVASTANYNKHFSAGSGSIGADALSEVWYFPDGYASVEATDFLNIVNPSLGVAHITVKIYYDDGETRSFDDTVDSGSKKHMLLNNFVEQNRWYSVAVQSDIGVVAEKTHYDSTYSAGYGSVGAVGTATDVYFSTGLVNDKTRSYLSVFNPSASAASVNLTFHYNDGTVRDLVVEAPSLTRTTVDLNKKALEGKTFGLRVMSSEPVIVNQVVYDETRSAGYSTYGLVMPEVEIVNVQDEGQGVDAQVSNEEYMLVEQDVVSASKFGGTIGEGLESVKKNTYDKSGSSVMVWDFEYSDDGASEEALRSALTGGLFKILEVIPEEVGGRDIHYFVSTKSRGYVWQSGSSMELVVASDKEDALGATEMILANTHEEAEESTSLATIFLILLGLILFVILVRWMFCRGPEEDEDEDAVWEEIIPSAKPSEKSKKTASRKKPAKKKKSKKEPDKKESDKKESDKKESDKKEDKNKEDGRDKKKDDRDNKNSAPKKRGRPKKEIPPEKKISIKEIPRDKLTAQDILDNLDEIPDYEDVFRHVNRDNEEIKQR